MKSPRVVGYFVEEDKNGIYIQNSKSESVHSKDLGEIFEYLLEEYDYTLKVMWDLDADLAPILRLMGEKALKELAGKDHKTWLKDLRCSIHYIPSKVFTLRYGRYKAIIFNISQFFPEMDSEPQTAVDVMGAANTILDEFEKLGFVPLTLASPVAVFREHRLRDLNPPKITELPKAYKPLAFFAYKSSGMAWIEALKIGYWDKTWDYDIINAYPSVIADLPDWRRYKKIWASDKVEKADYGWLKGTVTIHDDVKVHPITYADANGVLYRPTGTWDTILTLPEVEFIKETGIGDFKVDRAWYISLKDYVYPLAPTINSLFERRQRAQDIRKFLLKRMSVGIYGLTAQVKDNGQEGEFFNPMWASYITALTRLKVARFIYKHKLEDNLIHVSTDGVLLDKPVSVKGIPQMGSWKESDIQVPALVIDSNGVWYADKHPRGLSLPTVLRMINNNPDDGYYPQTLKRHYTMREAVDDGKPELVGQIIDTTTVIDLVVTEHTRKFEKVPRTGKQLLASQYSSQPLRVRDLSKSKVKEGNHNGELPGTPVKRRNGDVVQQPRAGVSR